MALPIAELSADDFKGSKTSRICYSKGTFDFDRKDYCPEVFRNILELHDIEYDDYMMSLCGEDIVRNVIPGKCGTSFVSYVDDRFVIKILQKSELKAMLVMLPNYYRHLLAYRDSLLCKFYGIHYVKPSGGVKVYFSVTGNEMKSNLRIHRLYDLKGSATRNKNVVVIEDTAIHKDVDFDFCFFLDSLVRRRILKQIKYDCEFLEAEGIMNYSLLLGMHIGKNEDSVNCKRSVSDVSSHIKTGSTIRRATSERNSTTKQDMFNDTSRENHGIELSPEYFYTPLQSFSGDGKLGKKMRARAKQTQKDEAGGAPSEQRNRVEEYRHVYLSFVIVDILQNYGLTKRVEHFCRSLQYDSKSVTSINPKAYSCRFQDFLSRVFQSEDSSPFESLSRSDEGKQ
ncbi:hypothetical protein L6164_003968 [Bauhinia variegata]|uniref:Uncharacterized protein n=1 Tax=Bauhinia variegata TaxID=167791 RepID=A0ACB9Q3J4_BAUVA|nr:hypothetical protein L6164_003968 [Bauhinia variegata]